ncbi:MAG: glycine zipper 2TM domain-containing protein [Gammaproteobacteria bacterium]|nr:glycine zipper 2TM domain-containing protein [Gammaproteobacteria bacterium]
MNNVKLTLIGLVTLALTPLASADYTSSRSGNADYRYADVIEVEPIIRYVRVDVPRRECWDEEVYYERRESRHYARSRNRGTAGATIAGGLIGGVIGRQIGGGSGRDAMTVVGTLVGSALASDRARRDRDYYEDRDSRDRHIAGEVRTVERCEVRREVHEEERIDGYRVKYVYDGREYSTRTDEDPGDRIKVRVSVSPARY